MWETPMTSTSKDSNYLADLFDSVYNLCYEHNSIHSTIISFTVSLKITAPDLSAHTLTTQRLKSSS